MLHTAPWGYLPMFITGIKPSRQVSMKICGGDPETCERRPGDTEDETRGR